MIFESHLLSMVVYAFFVALVMALIRRDDTKAPPLRPAPLRRHDGRALAFGWFMFLFIRNRVIELHISGSSIRSPTGPSPTSAPDQRRRLLLHHRAERLARRPAQDDLREIFRRGPDPHQRRQHPEDPRQPDLHPAGTMGIVFQTSG